MDDDFDTPAAMAVIFDAGAASEHGDRRRRRSSVPRRSSRRSASSPARSGLELDDGTAPAGDDDAEIDALVRQRDEARDGGDFAEADRIRDELAARGITLEDTPAGTIWHR